LIEYNTRLDNLIKDLEIDIKDRKELVNDISGKLLVHEISVIRNLQYDIDNIIKEIELF